MSTFKPKLWTAVGVAVVLGGATAACDYEHRGGRDDGWYGERGERGEHGERGERGEGGERGERGW